MRAPDEYEDVMPMEERMRRRNRFDPEKNPDVVQGLRTIMEGIGAPGSCGSKRCRRAGACVMPRVDCAWRNLPLLQQYVFPLLQRMGGG